MSDNIEFKNVPIIPKHSDEPLLLKINHIKGYCFMHYDSRYFVPDSIGKAVRDLILLKEEGKNG